MIGTEPVSKGVRKIAPGSTRLTPVVRNDEVPRGFDLDTVRQSFINRTRGSAGVNSVGSKMVGRDDGSGSGDGDHDSGHHDDGYDDGYNDGYHDGYHDEHHDHHDEWWIDIDFNFYYTDSCPNGWWYLYGDYDGDGYTDYVCTNGSRSIYWYGWSGSYWGASPWYGWYGGSYSSGYNTGYNSGYNNGYGNGFDNGYQDGYSWWSYSVPDRYRGVVGGSDDGLVDDPTYGTGAAPADPDAMPEALPLSALEVARLEMSIGEPEVAIEAYRAHLGLYPDDWSAVRELGVALIRNGDRGDGIALLSYAYSMDPELARRSLPMSLFGNSASDLRDTVIDTVGWGHRNPSSSVWLAVAVLMQAEGRDGPALRMIERAYEYGLTPDVGGAMGSALSHR